MLKLAAIKNIVIAAFALIAMGLLVDLFSQVHVYSLNSCDYKGSLN